MRQAFTSKKKVQVTSLADRTLDANVKLGDFGACRRR